MNLLLAVDGTEYSEKALRMATRFRFRSGDFVKILYVIDMALPYSTDAIEGLMSPEVEIEKTVTENAKRIVDNAMATFKNSLNSVEFEISGEILFGSPEKRILETAQHINADLIIVGSHGYKNWERLLLGSVSHSIVHHAHCSVLVARS